MLICVRAAGINPRPCGRAASNDALQKKIDRILAGVDRSGICVRAASTELSGSFLESLVDASCDQLGTLPGHLLPECCQLLGLIAQTLSIGLAVAATEDGERVCMLETDAQGTVSNWGIRRANPDPAVERIADRFQLERALRMLVRRSYTLAIIDTPGSEPLA